jgi:hypothetical protein
MKRLILVLNDAPSTGKSTLTGCLNRYLNRHQANHQVALLASEEDPFCDHPVLEVDSLTGASFLGFIDQADISVIEIETGLADFFARFYQRNELEQVLHEAGFQLSVVLPVTSEPDTFESIIRAAEVYSDSAEYTIAHLVTGSYDDDSSAWDRSYAARVMDMFEAVELHVPEVGFQVEMELRANHVELPQALSEPDAVELFGRDFELWLNRAMGQVESARSYLFGDSLVLTAAPIVEPKSRRAARRKSANLG